MIERLSIPEVWTYTPKRFADSRGWFSETFNAETLAELRGIAWVQDNQSYSRARGTLRGLHFQIPPKSQDKLIRVTRGAVLDVAVDLRRASRSHGKWVSAVLSAENGAQMFVPKGFAHGFVTLEPDTDVLYKISDYYSREHERGIAWNDRTLAIDWTFSAATLTMADRDQALPQLADLPDFF